MRKHRELLQGVSENVLQKCVVPEITMSCKHQCWGQWRILGGGILADLVVKSLKEVAENQSLDSIREKPRIIKG